MPCELVVNLELRAIRADADGASVLVDNAYRVILAELVPHGPECRPTLVGSVAPAARPTLSCGHCPPPQLTLARGNSCEFEP
jgi:hypothetical protein